MAKPDAALLVAHAVLERAAEIEQDHVDLGRETYLRQSLSWALHESFTRSSSLHDGVQVLTRAALDVVPDGPRTTTVEDYAAAVGVVRGWIDDSERAACPYVDAHDEGEPFCPKCGELDGEGYPRVRHGG